MKPPTYAAVTAYAHGIGWEITRDQIAAFIQFYQIRDPAVWRLARRWQAAIRMWHRDMPRPVAPPSRLARAVDLALNCPP